MYKFCPFNSNPWQWLMAQSLRCGCKFVQKSVTRNDDNVSRADWSMLLNDSISILVWNGNGSYMNTIT
jgi:L-ribulose-5-phosphate 3-epimerase UlaE